MRQDEITHLLQHPDHMQRCAGLKRIAAKNERSREYMSLAAAALSDAYPVVVENALGALETMVPLDDGSVISVINAFGKYVQEQGCSYACCGLDALHHPSLIEVAVRLILSQHTAVGNNGLFPLLRQAANDGRLTAKVIDEILAVFVEWQKDDAVRYAYAHGFSEPNADAFFIRG